MKFNVCQSKESPHPEAKKLTQESPFVAVTVSPTEAEVATQDADDVVLVMLDVVVVADVVEEDDGLDVVVKVVVVELKMVDVVVRVDVVELEEEVVMSEPVSAPITFIAFIVNIVESSMKIPSPATSPVQKPQCQLKSGED